MNKTLRFSLIIGLLLNAIVVIAEESQSQSLFNGKDLSGWYGNNPHSKTPLHQQQEQFNQHWKVVDGVMVNDGKGPYATSSEDYGDVEFELEYKTVVKSDSGIYMKGTPQIQIWDYTKEGGKWKLGSNKGSGGLWNNSKGALGKDPLVLADLPFGEWNHMKVRMVGSRTWVWLNSKLVVNGAIWENFWDRGKPLPPKGPIHLQTHGAEISWRNINIRELTSEESIKVLRANDQAQKYRSIFDGKTLTGWAGAVENYTVVDGAIQCKKNKGGTVYFDKNLKDFSVRFDFKLPPGGNNGLAIRYPGQGDTAYVGMCELQILDNSHEKYAKLDPRQFHGSAYGIAAAERGYLRPVGQWNTQEVTVTGHKIKVELNGSIILNTDVSKVDENDFMQKRPHPGILRKKGFFGFAGHGSDVAFRNVVLREL